MVSFNSRGFGREDKSGEVEVITSSAALEDILLRDYPGIITDAGKVTDCSTNIRTYHFILPSKSDAMAFLNQYKDTHPYIIIQGSKIIGISQAECTPSENV